MRLWHYKLLPFLPRQQLLSQWRECCCIAKSITEKDTPNHILVNKIMDYPIDHFVEYCAYVSIEMEYGEQIFPEWHDNIYLRQCLYNLEEKAMCKGIPADEWQKIYDRFKDFTPLWCGE